MSAAAPVEVVSETPDLTTMQRADVPAVWEDFRAQLAKLKTTAETLTVTSVDDKAGMKLAHDARMGLKDLRVEIEKKRKELGEEALRRKQKIDGDAKTLKDAIEPLEARLLEQEEFAERAEATRQAELKTKRTELLSDYDVDPSFYALDKMPEEQFATLLAATKADHEAKIAAAKKAVAEREAREKAEAEERERIRLENERLKAEAEKREAELNAERARVAKEKAEAEDAARQERLRLQAVAEVERQKAEAARIAAEKKAREEREAIEAKARVEREKLEAAAAEERKRVEAEKAAAAAKAAEAIRIAGEKAKAEREERERLEAEIAKKKAAEEAAAKAKAAAEEKAAKAPDKEKLMSLAKCVRNATADLPTMATAEGKAALNLALMNVATLANDIEEAAKAL